MYFSKDVSVAPSTCYVHARQRNLKQHFRSVQNATITSQFGFVLEVNSAPEIT